MLQAIQYDVLQHSDLQVLASAVRAYMRNGWVPKGEVEEHKNGYSQEMERHPVAAAERKKQESRQKSWVRWPTF